MKYVCFLLYGYIVGASETFFGELLLDFLGLGQHMIYYLLQDINIRQVLSGI